jgi:aminopeptidase-like protein
VNDPEAWIGAFLTIVTNDERQFNAPGVRVPMLSLSRVARPGSSDSFLYPEYHTHFDTPAAVSVQRLQQSRDLVLSMIDLWEANRVPINRFRGEVFLSRYGIGFDFTKDPQGSQALFDVMFMLDGTRSLLDIAEQCDLPFDRVRHLVDRFHQHGLVDYA